MSDAFLHGAEVIEIDDGARPIRAVATSVIGIVGTAPFADPAIFPLDTPVLITRPSQAAALMATWDATAHANASVGSLPSAVADIHDQASPPIVIVRVDVAAAGGSQLANQLGEVRGVQAESSGVYALLAAKQLVKAQPRILIATGWTHQVPQAGDPLVDVANPVAAALKVCADKLRAVAIVDGPNDTNTEAIQFRQQEFLQQFLKDVTTDKTVPTSIRLITDSDGVARRWPDQPKNLPPIMVRAMTPATAAEAGRVTMTPLWSTALMCGSMK